jgi:hypothetical protein
MKTYYDVLGVSQDVGLEVINAAYHALTRKYHVDAPGGDAEKMTMIDKAYECLSDPERRKAYDQKLAPLRSTETATSAQSYSPSLSNTSSASGNSDSQQNIYKDTYSPAQDIATNSLLDTWKTSVGFTILGIICKHMLARIPYVGILFLITGFVIGIIYDLVIYPSYFTSSPITKSNKGISFLNGLFGGIIFGSIFNGNLTNKRKGYSNIVQASLSIFALFAGMIFLVTHY